MRAYGSRLLGVMRRLGISSAVLALLFAFLTPASAIVNGQQISNASNWSFMVAIGCSSESNSPFCEGRQYAATQDGMYSSQFCAGSLIAETVIVTAAHCLHPANAPALTAKDLAVGGGTTALSAMKDLSTVVGVIGVYEDPRYDIVTQEHDLALLRLSQTLKNGKPVAYATGPLSASASTPAQVAGWGAVLPTGQSPNVAQFANVTIQPAAQCAFSLGREFSADSMLCAGGQNAVGWIDACRGDSGGPLITTISGVRTLVGMVSWGKGCAEGTPGAYTSISESMPRTLGIFPTFIPVAHGEVHAATVIVSGDPWSQGVWSVIAERGNVAKSCGTLVTPLQLLASCTVTGLEQGGLWTISVVPPAGVPKPADLTVRIDGSPVKPRIASVTRMTTAGTATVVFLPAAAKDAAVTQRQISCTATGSIVTATSKSLTTVIRGLKPKLSYRCQAAASNAHGRSPQTSAFTIARKGSTTPA